MKPLDSRIELDPSFNIYNELMLKRVSEILLVSSPYDAFIMEEDGRLAERIIHEYRGLNLSRPPRLTWVSNAHEAFFSLSKNHFDLVIAMPHIDDMDADVFAKIVKEEKAYKNLPIFLLAHNTTKILSNPRFSDNPYIDRIFEWNGNTDLLLAIVKNVEDRLNVTNDIKIAGVRVIILVEDSPYYTSSLLPLLYKEIVSQTRANMEESVNEGHKLMKMRARPKILVADNFDDAEFLYRKFKSNLLSIFSDVRFPKEEIPDDEAGFSLLSMIRKECPDLALLMLSSEDINRDKARKIPAVFANKNSPTLHNEIRAFMVNYLGFGDFVFRTPEGNEVARVSNLKDMETVLKNVPVESVYYHARQNHFSSWLLARSEIQLALKLKPISPEDFKNSEEIRQFLISCFKNRRKSRQKGVVTDFVANDFDPDTDFMKIGMGSLGGKARGLAFISMLFQKSKEISELHKQFPDISIRVPNSLVISTEGFDAFLQENELKEPLSCECEDARIREMFLNARFPDWLADNLKSYLERIRYPLAIRSSSLLEDAMYQPRAGIYNTYMIPNNHHDLNVRLSHLIRAVKLVYASTFFEASRSFAKSSHVRTEEEKMAVIIQELTGGRYGKYFYPAMSGVAQSYNYYPISYMKSSEGIIHLALGLGRTVVEGGAVLRFSPYYPNFIPQFPNVDETLKNAQQTFYALKMDETDFPDDFGQPGKDTLEKLDVMESIDHYPVRFLSSEFQPDDNRIRDFYSGTGGYPVLTFANILKHQSLPVPKIVADILQTGRKGMGCPVEIEFAVNLAQGNSKPEFNLLQIRPMSMMQQNVDVEIKNEEIEKAICYCDNAMGNGILKDISDIVYVNPETFDTARTKEIAKEIGEINQKIQKRDVRYILLGPGRWGTADPWLGIPVSWKDISGVGAIIETSYEQLNSDPSQGTHFFNNITSQGISYLTVNEKNGDFIRWDFLESQTVQNETDYLKHIYLERPLTLKVDGRKSRSVILQ